MASTSDASKEAAHEGAVPSRWITMRDAASRYDVTEKTVRRWISDGLIEAKRFGPRLIRVNLDSLEAMGKLLAWTDEY